MRAVPLCLVVGLIFAAACRASRVDPAVPRPIPPVVVDASVVPLAVDAGAALWHPPELRDPDVQTAVVAASWKYNLPRWLYYAVIHRESTFERCAVHDEGPTGDSPEDGRGLTQLSFGWYNGFPYPEGNTAPNNADPKWRANMGLDVPAFRGWIDMADVTPLAAPRFRSKAACQGALAPSSDAFDPVANLDRYSSGYAAPQYRLRRRLSPGDTPEATLRKVAYHWRYGLWGSKAGDYPTDPSAYLPTYDAYVARYKAPVEAEDGVYTGPSCAPPYRAAGCSEPVPIPPPQPPPAVDASAPAAAVVLGAGVNLNGADFGSALPGTEGRDYVWPTAAEVDYFRGKGFATFRIGFRWERLQPVARGELAPVYLGKLDALVTYATSQGANVVLNPQNFARYYDKIVGSAEVPAAVFADFWRRLAERYRGNARVVFGLVNEPHDMPTEQWLGAANAAIAAIRAAGAMNLIAIPGNAWTGASHWTSSWYGLSNSVAMLRIVDPANHHVFELHNYFDPSAGGSATDCVSGTIGSERLANVVEWARKNGRRVWIGEIGTPNTPTCAAATKDFLAYARDNADVVSGWAIWSGGPWWNGTHYPLSIEPEGSVDKPQLAWYLPFLNPAQPTPIPPPQPPPVPVPPTPEATLTVSIRTTQDWTAGYCWEATLSNKTTAYVTWRSITVDVKDARVRTVGSVWGATLTGRWTALSTVESGSVKPGASVNVGFCVDRGASKATAVVEAVAY